MDIDVSSLIVSFVVSSIGFVLLYYGRKMRRAPQMGIGLILLVFPYFVSNVALMLLIAVLLLAAMWAVLRLGY